MSQSPNSAITTFSPILTRRRARDKLDSAPTCDGHCKNKSTLTDTSANFTDQPHRLCSPSVQPTSLFTFQATQRFPETTSPHFMFEFPSVTQTLRIRSRIIARSFTTFPDHLQIVSRKIISNGAIQLEWCNRTDHNMFHSST